MKKHNYLRSMGYEHTSTTQSTTAVYKRGNMTEVVVHDLNTKKDTVDSTFAGFGTERHQHVEFDEKRRPLLIETETIKTTHQYVEWPNDEYTDIVTTYDKHDDGTVTPSLVQMVHHKTKDGRPYIQRAEVHAAVCYPTPIFEVAAALTHKSEFSPEVEDVTAHDYRIHDTGIMTTIDGVANQTDTVNGDETMITRNHWICALNNVTPIPEVRITKDNVRCIRDVPTKTGYKLRIINDDGKIDIYTKDETDDKHIEIRTSRYPWEDGIGCCVNKTVTLRYGEYRTVVIKGGSKCTETMTLENIDRIMESLVFNLRSLSFYECGREQWRFESEKNDCIDMSILDCLDNRDEFYDDISIETYLDSLFNVTSED
jgi:hypothetical protein